LDVQGFIHGLKAVVFSRILGITEIMLTAIIKIADLDILFIAVQKKRKIF